MTDKNTGMDMNARLRLSRAQFRVNAGCAGLCSLAAVLLMTQDNAIAVLPLAYAPIFVFTLLANCSSSYLFVGASLRAWCSFLGFGANLVALTGVGAWAVLNIGHAGMRMPLDLAGLLLLSGLVVLFVLGALHVWNLTRLAQVLRSEG